MGFKKLRGVRLPESKQGLIRYTCLDYDDQPARIQEKIERLCRQCGGPYCAALREVMCSQRSITSIALRHCISESALYRMRKEFYEAWGQK